LWSSRKSSDAHFDTASPTEKYVAICPIKQREAAEAKNRKQMMIQGRPQLEKTASKTLASFPGLASPVPSENPGITVFPVYNQFPAAPVFFTAWPAGRFS
jgi:hypothetical protein